MNATIGERLKAVEPYLGDDEIFLATYGDGLTDAPLPGLIASLIESDKLATFPVRTPVVQRPYRQHVGGRRRSRESGHEHSDVRINGGFFALRREILDHIQPGDELVEETFSRLIPEGRIGAVLYDGFFGRWTRSRIDNVSSRFSNQGSRRGRFSRVTTMLPRSDRPVVA